MKGRVPCIWCGKVVLLVFMKNLKFLTVYCDYKMLHIFGVT